VNVGGRLYGPECAGAVLADPGWLCVNCGKVKPIEAMATPDCCEDCAGLLGD
jgi:hypothetical protein